MYLVYNTSHAQCCIKNEKITNANLHHKKVDILHISLLTVSIIKRESGCPLVDDSNKAQKFLTLDMAKKLKSITNLTLGHVRIGRYLLLTYSTYRH